MGGTELDRLCVLRTDVPSQTEAPNRSALSEDSNWNSSGRPAHRSATGTDRLILQRGFPMPAEDRVETHLDIFAVNGPLPAAVSGAP